MEKRYVGEKYSPRVEEGVTKNCFARFLKFVADFVCSMLWGSIMRQKRYIFWRIFSFAVVFVKRGDKWNLNGIIQFQSHHLNQSSKRKNPLTYVFAIAWCCGLNQIVDIEGSKILEKLEFFPIQFGIVSTSHNLYFLKNEKKLPHQKSALQGTFFAKSMPIFSNTLLWFGHWIANWIFESSSKVFFCIRSKKSNSLISFRNPVLPLLCLILFHLHTKAEHLSFYLFSKMLTTSNSMPVKPSNFIIQRLSTQLFL